jgi:hypothetical protein
LWVAFQNGWYSVADRLPLIGLPREVNVPGRGKVIFGPFEIAKRLARDYMRHARLPYRSVETYSKVDPERARRIAQAYDEMADSPSDPIVMQAYQALIDESLAQYQFIKKTGLKIELITMDMKDPYRTSPRLAILDVVENSHLWVYPSDIGFGSEGAESYLGEHPLLQPTDEFIGSKRLLVNDVFRIVHDYFGHTKEGIGFRADGEENAWRCHAAMYSRLALGAITTELRGQNSWVNFGPYGEANRTASAANTSYAVQKAGLMPGWVLDEGREDPKK